MRHKNNIFGLIPEYLIFEVRATVKYILRFLIFVHRWVGIALCVVFLFWFPSGIGMMYWTFPGVTDGDLLDRSPKLDPAKITLSPVEAAEKLGMQANPTQVRLNSFDGRPVYRFRGGGGGGGGRGGGRGGGGSRMIYADTGEEHKQVSPEMVDRIAAAWAGKPLAEAKKETVEEADQWTVAGNFRNIRPLWKYSWPDGQQVYLNGSTGEVVQYTTFGKRVAAHVSAIPHWFYYTPLRKHQPQWLRFMIWSSLIGTVGAILGMIVAVWMYSPKRRYRLAGQPTGIPYRGQKRWHWIFGMVFGVATVTWTFSGLMSLGPFPLVQRLTAPAGQRGQQQQNPQQAQQSSPEQPPQQQATAETQPAARSVAAQAAAPPPGDNPPAAAPQPIGQRPGGQSGDVQVSDGQRRGGGAGERRGGGNRGGRGGRPTANNQGSTRPAGNREANPSAANSERVGNNGGRGAGPADVNRGANTQPDNAARGGQAAANQNRGGQNTGEAVGGGGGRGGQQAIEGALRGRVRMADFGPVHPRDLLAKVPDLDVKELEWTSFASKPLFSARLDGGRSQLLSVDGAQINGFDHQQIIEIVKGVVPDPKAVEIKVLDEYDLYYLDRTRQRPLPVLLVLTNDAERTRYYIDPRSARVVGSYSSRNWVNRWLYTGLHSLNFPFLYNNRPLWDIVVITFMVGGTALCVTSLILAWRTLGRKLKRAAANDLLPRVG